MSHSRQPGYQPYQPYQPGAYPPPQLPPRRSHRARNIILITIGSVVAFFVVIGVIGATLSAVKPPRHPAANPGGGSAPAGPQQQPARATARFGHVVRDGDFAFDVRKMTCGKAAARAIAAGGYGGKVPAGAAECIVTMTVTDDKGEAQEFFDGDQYAYDAKGRKLSADTTGGVFLKGDQDATQVNPGITITAKVPFQIPQGDRIVKLVLHDSAFSGGVTVQVGG